MMTQSNDIAIQLKNVTKVYRLCKSEKARLRTFLRKNTSVELKHAINDVSLTIRRGEAVALFGRNAAGTSTILKMITGVAFPTTGRIRVNGRVSALLELGAGFDSELTGRENIYFRGEVQGIKTEEIKRIEGDIIKFADLGSYIDQPIRTYSSGMKARLGFAINANIRPDILIVDEALSVGDQRFRAKCRAKVNEIMESGVTFLFVTHSVNEAKAFCKRGIVLRHGKVVFDGGVNEAAAYYEDMIKQI